MLLYHATQVELPTGHKQALVRDLADLADDPRRKAEKLLEQRRPEEKPPRLSSWFAFDTPNLAAIYLAGELKYRSRKGQPYLYAVKMDTFSKQPMRLAEAVARKLLEDENGMAETAAQEYWTPSREWKIWEYISSEIEVVAPLEQWPGLIAVSEVSINLQKGMGHCGAVPGGKFGKLLNESSYQVRLAASSGARVKGITLDERGDASRPAT